jgi:hypothetical protein
MAHTRSKPPGSGPNTVPDWGCMQGYEVHRSLAASWLPGLLLFYPVLVGHLSARMLVMHHSGKPQSASIVNCGSSGTLCAGE